MAVVQFEDMFPIIQPHVMGCPNVTIEAHLAEAAAEFCEQTQLWRIDLDADTTVAGEPFYELDIPTGTVLEAVLWLRLDEQLLVHSQDVFEAPVTTTDKPLRFAIYQDTQIRLYPTPDDVYEFTGVAVVKPSLAASVGVESFIYETHGRTIAHGALSKLMSIPDKQWTNLDMAGAYNLMFERGITEARVRDFRNVPLRVRARPFA